MFRAAKNAFGTVLIGVGIFKQPQQKFHPQYAAAGRIQHGHFHFALFDEVRNCVLPHIMREIIQLQIDAGFQPQTDRLLRRFRNKVPVIQARDSRQITAHKSRHTVLPAQDIRQNFMVHRNRDAVDGVIAAHRVARLTVNERGFKHRQAVAENIVPSHRAGGAVQTAHRVAVSYIVLRLRGNGIGVFQTLPLHTPHGLAGKLCTQMRVLAVGFLAAAIARVTNQIHDRAVGFVYTAGSRFGGDSVSHFAPKSRVKGGSKTDLLGKAGGVVREQTVQGFFAEQERNPQTGIFDSIALHRVSLYRRHTAKLDTSNAVAVHKLGEALHVHRNDLAVFILRCEIAGKILVGLHNLFFCRHSRQKIVQTLLNRKVRVLVSKHSTALLTFFKTTVQL